MNFHSKLETGNSKLLLYEALYALNRGFEDTLQSLERLEHLGLFRLEHLNAFKVALERTRAEANEEPKDPEDVSITHVASGNSLASLRCPKSLSARFIRKALTCGGW